MTEVSDEFLKRHLTLLRLAEGEAIELAAEMKLIHQKILELMEEYEYKSEKQVELLIRTEMQQSYYTLWPEDLEDMAVAIIADEILWTENTLDSFVDELEVVENHNKQRAAAVEKARNRSIHGHKLETWLDKQYAAHTQGILNILDDGYKKGKAFSETIRDIRITTGRYERDIKTLTRAHFMASAQAARDEMFKEFDDYIDGHVWNSTLDSRTTPLICGVRDQKPYDKNKKPIGHNYLWGQGPGLIHWNCRSSSYPLLIGAKVPAPRAAVIPGKNYKRGDDLNSRGKVRKLTKETKNKGIFDVQQLTQKTNYETWLRQQTDRNMDFVADVLGSKKKAEQFKSGASLASLGATNPVANPIKRKRKKRNQPED